jgi:hypothetical protein
MAGTRDQFETWIRDYLRKRYPELEQPLLAAIDRYDAIGETAKISPDLLKPIVEAASSQRRPLYENVTTLLGQLTEHYQEARDAVAAMSVDSRSLVRFNAILCLGSSTPLAFVLELLRRGLHDKSARVRQKASDWAGRLRLRDVVPDLESALPGERNSKTKETMSFVLRLLRDGYTLELDGDGFVLCTFRHNGGVTCRFVSRSEAQTRGIDAIVNEMSRKSDH